MARQVAILTAHPDDEVLFFAPTIRELLRCQYSLHVICLSNGNDVLACVHVVYVGSSMLAASRRVPPGPFPTLTLILPFWSDTVRHTGNYYGLGAVRGKELLACCARLGLPPSTVHLVERSDLKDGPEKWAPEAVGSAARDVLGRLNVDLVITFDDGGVSGHANHCTLAPGMRWLLDMGRGSDHATQEGSSSSSTTDGGVSVRRRGRCQRPDGGARPLEVLVLETTSWARKYSGVFDVATSWALHRLDGRALRSQVRPQGGCSAQQVRLSGSGQLNMGSRGGDKEFSDLASCVYGHGGDEDDGRDDAGRDGMPLLVVSGPGDVAATLWALLAHASQLAWYRLLFALVARYTYVNTLRPLHPRHT